MQSWVKVDLTTSQPVLTQQHRCDDLIDCDPASGEAGTPLQPVVIESAKLEIR